MNQSTIVALAVAAVLALPACQEQRQPTEPTRRGALTASITPADPAGRHRVADDGPVLRTAVESAGRVRARGVGGRPPRLARCQGRDRRHRYRLYEPGPGGTRGSRPLDILRARRRDAALSWPASVQRPVL